jgi:hypothetical protein
MHLSRSDVWLANLAYRASGLLNRLSGIENCWLEPEVINKPIDRPIFVTGLARSGSTVLLELLSTCPRIGTHRYCDFPFLATPWLWNRFQQRFGSSVENAPVERPHRDRIVITPESPESMDEPIWQSWFPWIHKRNSIHEIPESTDNPRFVRFYREHINKILFLRKANRYASKNNYHFTRIEYLTKLFPDSRIIIPIRHPFSHVDSLVRQHELFSSYAKNTLHLGRYLQAAGHYEFGPQRIPIQMGPQSIQELKQAESSNQDHILYAIQWRDVYSKALTWLEANSQQEPRAVVVKFEELCKAPNLVWIKIRDCCDLGDHKPDFKHIDAPNLTQRLSTLQHSEIWDIVAVTAKWYGYSC